MSADRGDFDGLVWSITEVHARLHQQAAKAVNTALTVRNWLIGGYIHEYELGGRDRADYYGERLIEQLANKLVERGVPRVDQRELRRYRLFFLTYPQIRSAVTAEVIPILPAVHVEQEIRETASPESSLSGSRLLRSLSFSHFVELLAIDDPVKRSFFEVQAITGQWSVRELRRQIATLLFERTGLAADMAATVARAHAGTEVESPATVIRDPYVFEFLGLRADEIPGESALEDALVEKVQEFLLELGRGFCFEARQKRILIGGDLFYVDLVFYHRLLKCHVLIELKVDDFRHEHLGQLNTYVTWFRRHELAEGDNPPIGLLLCTGKNHALVEYALAGMDNHLFVSKYLLVLPGKDELQRFVERQVAELGDGG